MRTIYAVTMWSGGLPAKKWQTFDKPELLPQGTGIRFTCRESKLSVEVIGSVSVEEYESGKDEIESIRDHFAESVVEVRARARAPRREDAPDEISRHEGDNGIERLF